MKRLGVVRICAVYLLAIGASLHAQPLQVKTPDDIVQAAADELLSSVIPDRSANNYFPQFAKERLRWIETQLKAGRLMVVVLGDLSNTNLDSGALMAAGIIEGQQAIILPRSRFNRWLNDAGRLSPPFTRQQRNDFMVGLVHEAVHLQNPEAGNPNNPSDFVNEELRTWREVTINVVRPLRTLGEPLSRRFIQVDNAFGTCGETFRTCAVLRSLLFPRLQIK